MRIRAFAAGAAYALFAFAVGYAMGRLEKPDQPPIVTSALADPTKLTVPFPTGPQQVLCWTGKGEDANYRWVRISQVQRMCVK